jgi:putative tricarboxylic transport membrane protein
MLDAAVFAEVVNQLTRIDILIMMVLGVAIGLIIGVLPGMGPVQGVAILLPVSFVMEPIVGMMLLLGVYIAGIYGGSISAIMINTPGTASAAATGLDGYPLAMQGKAYPVLNVSLQCSFIGGIISVFFLLFFAPQIARFALTFGPPEFFMMALLGLTAIAYVSGKDIYKGIMMGCTGLILSTVGIDPMTAVPRFNFGVRELAGGIEVVGVLIGLFSISEIFRHAFAKSKKLQMVDISKQKNRGSWRDLIPLRMTIFKSTLIGAVIGAIPAIGGPVACFVAYGEARRSAKDPDSFGKGNMHGVAAAESANNATTGTTLIPMMTLGIPGDTVTAIMLGALIVHGMTPGPRLFIEHPVFAYSIIFAMFILNILMLIQGKLAIRVFSRISDVNLAMLFPVVMSVCLIGTFALTNSVYPVILALIMGVFGFLVQKHGFAPAPLVVGVILGRLTEVSLRQSMIMSHGSWLIFFERPIPVILLILILLLLFLPVIRNLTSKKKTVLYR